MNVAAFDLGASHGDLAIWDGEQLHLSKHRLFEQSAAAGLVALVDGLQLADLDPADLEELRLCQTWALNAVLTRSASPVTLITTRGFGDVLTLALQDRADLYDPVARSDAPLFLVNRVIELNERMSAAGEVVEAPNLTELQDIGKSPIAVCLLNAHQNGAHETAVANALPDSAVFLSHLIDPAPREYERAVGACLEAWLHGALSSDLDAFRNGLAALGFQGRLLLADGTGMLLQTPLFVDLLTAGPAASAAAATGFGFEGPVIGADLGSCSLDLSLIDAGLVVSRKDGNAGGIPLRQVAADTTSCALGGSSRPLSEGPSVDDALTALGRINGAAHSDISHAIAIATVAALVQGVRNRIIDFAVARNLDPFNVPLVMMGGLGAVLAADIAEALGVAQIHLAPAPSTAGALALLSAPETVRRYHLLKISLTSSDNDSLQSLIAALRRDAPQGTRAVWTAEIAPSEKAIPERVPLSSVPASLEDLKLAWQVHMHYATGVRPVHGFLHGLELLSLREPAGISPPRSDEIAPDGWRCVPTKQGGTTLVRVSR